MAHSEISLDHHARLVVEISIRDVCSHRDWSLYAANVRSNHVHVVIAAPQSPERVMNDLKVICTRRLKDGAVFNNQQKIWSRHGSTRYLWNDRNVRDACAYVMEQQGD
ncbi:MAG: transposase [Planctomycetota bacterium]